VNFQTIIIAIVFLIVIITAANLIRPFGHPFPKIENLPTVIRKIVLMLLLLIITMAILMWVIGHFFLEGGFSGVWMLVPLVAAVVSGFWGLQIIRNHMIEQPSLIQSVLIFCAVPILGFIFVWAIVFIIFLLLFVFNIYRG
jgi:hypothetical protein